MSKVLTREDILQASDIKIERVHTPEWGGDVYVKGMTGRERDEFEISVVETRGRKQELNLSNVRAKLASLTICDEAGIRLFTEADIPVLADKSAGALQRVFEVAQRLSGIGTEAINEMTVVLKNDQSAASTSG